MDGTIKIIGTTLCTPLISAVCNTIVPRVIDFIITLKRNENEFSLLRLRRLCFSTEKRVSVEKRRKNVLASKHFYLYNKLISGELIWLNSIYYYLFQ